MKALAGAVSGGMAKASPWFAGAVAPQGADRQGSGCGFSLCVEGH